MKLYEKGVYLLNGNEIVEENTSAVLQKKRRQKIQLPMES